ncbi:MAG: hypothetical protein BGO69_07780 [Bacteroidetes bacterium 46-16]|nr:MAG: hypothetical protein BGO69_07780 [Bacteroidetes bacterium 46-16]
MSKLAFIRSGILKKLNINYRVVFIDDESLQEVASFKLTMRKLYILLSTLFVVIVTLTVCVLLLTPLKYYVPGYGSDKTHMQVIRLKRNMDSLSDLVAAQQLYEDNIKNIVRGTYNGQPDTTKLDLNQVRKEEMSIFPQTDEIKKKAIEEVRQENKAKKNAK